MRARWRTITMLFTLATVVYAVKTRRSHGTLLKVPFEFRVPTLGRIRERWWNPEDERVFTPGVLGVGWTVNAYQLLRRLGITGKGDRTPEEPAVKDS